MSERNTDVSILSRIPRSCRSAGIALLISLSLVSCRQSDLPDRAVIHDRVREILQLPTAEQIYRDIVYLDREKSFLFFKTVDKRVLFSVDIRVQAGIDAGEGLEIIPDPGRPDAVTLFLPPPKILLIDADESSIEQYFVKEAGERIRRLEYSDEIDSVKEQVKRSAIERGILVRAERNAREVLSGLLELSGFRTIRIRVRKHARAALTPENEL